MNINENYISELSDQYKKSYIDYKNGLFNTEEWGSHQPLLIHLVNTITEGNVLEFGMGDNSTPLLHLLCEKHQRKLFSYEFDSNWFPRYKHYENDNHKLFLLNENNFRNNEYDFEKSSIAFIDSHPVWTRHHLIEFLKDKVDYLIIHDTSYAPNGIVEAYNDYNFDSYKNVLHFDKVSRVSTFFTNKDIPEEISKIFK